MARDAQYLNEYAAEYTSLGPTAFQVKYRGAVLVGVGLVARVADRPFTWKRRTLGAVPEDDVLEAGAIVERVWRVRKAEGAQRGGAIAVGQSADSDLVLPEYTVSTQHATFSFDAAGMSITDLGSLNGTKVDGVLIEPLQPFRIKDKQQITIGRILFDYLENPSFIATVKRYADAK
ncbi:MAG: FHA domain-containing protein [Deltaproteobacteria bacterium]|nr:FHA domain-containing protein [Deltaproteobacteria bacterium]